MRRRGSLLLLTALLAVVLACGSHSGGKASTSSVSRGATVVPATGQESVLGGAAAEERASKEINVAAASDLRPALTALKPAIEQACDTRLTFVFGSSGQLKEQILAGAGYALFLSADTSYVDELARAGRIAPGGSTAYAAGRLALAWRSGLPSLTRVADLSRGDVQRIAIANPAHAPYGRAAQEAMIAAGVWQSLHSRFVLGENIRQATDYVQQGNADAGLVALALVIDTDIQYTVVEASQHKPIIQGGGVVKGTGGELTARCALQQLLDPAGQMSLRRFGFESVPAP
jgi:molybdate transport system substrate-binding protein